MTGRRRYSASTSTIFNGLLPISPHLPHARAATSFCSEFALLGAFWRLFGCSTAAHQSESVANVRFGPVAEVGGPVRMLSACHQSYDGARMLIRQLQSSDQRVASDSLQQFGYDVGTTELAARINRVLANPTHFAAVAEEGSRIYGLVHAYERPALERAYEVVLQSLVVDQ